MKHTKGLSITKFTHFLIKSLRNYKCGFRKGFNAEQCFIYVFEKWREYLDTGGHGSALLTDLLKPFECIDHQLLIAKINAYGVDTNSLYSLASYQKAQVLTVILMTF